MPKLNVLMVNNEFPPIGGGEGRVNYYLLKEFSHNKDLKVDVLTSGLASGFVKEKFSDNITVYRLGLRKKNLHFWRRIEVIEWLLKAHFYYHRLLKKNNYDLVHVFNAFPSGWLSYITRRRLPYIISLSGSDVPGYNSRLTLDYRLMSGLFLKIWSNASRIVAPSQGLRDLAFKFMPGLDIRVIPHGVDTGVFHPAEKHSTFSQLRILSVCRLISRKRIDMLIRAVARLKELGFNIKLSIAGEGNIKGQLQELANKLSVCDSIFFLGGVTSDRMPQLYRDNDIFLMSSVSEGMSIAMLEAMASGLPIITTRCEGVEELVINNGIIVEQPDPQDFATAIKYLVQNPQVYRTMSSASIERSFLFTWSSFARRYFEYYREMLEKKK